MGWVSITMTVKTPLFMDGARGHAELRIPALRGALRRAYRLAHADAGHDHAAVRRDEALVWGSTDHPSEVALRAVGAPLGTTRQAGWATRPGLAYLLGQGLFAHGAHGGIQRGYVAPGGRWTFQVNPGRHGAVVAATLVAVERFGLGARTRRGWGAVSFEGLELLTPEQPPAMLELPDSPSEGWGNAPFPSLGGSWARCAEWRKRTWQDALDEAGKRLRAFRSPVKRDDHEGYRKFVSNDYTSFVRAFIADGKRPPQGATSSNGVFGLPLSFRTSAGGTASIQPGGGGERRPSPLWVRPRQDDDGWTVECIVDADALLPAANPVLRKGGETVELSRAKDNEARQHLAEAVAAICAQDWPDTLRPFRLRAAAGGRRGPRQPAGPPSPPEPRPAQDLGMGPATVVTTAGDALWSVDARHDREHVKIVCPSTGDRALLKLKRGEAAPEGTFHVTFLGGLRNGLRVAKRVPPP